MNPTRLWIVHSFKEAIRRQLAVAAAVATLLCGIVFASRWVLISAMMTDGAPGSAIGPLLDATDGVLSFWTFIGTIIAVYLGATAISTEIRGRTLANVLSKPIDRWTLIVAKAVGGTLAVVLYQGLGFGICYIVLSFVDRSAVPVAYAASLLKACTFSFAMLAIAIFLAQVLRPAAAGGIAGLLVLLHPGLGKLAEAASMPVRWLGSAMYFLAPAVWPSSLTNLVDSSNIDGFEWSWLARVAAENLAYGGLLVGLAATIFTVREVRLR